MDAIQEIRDQIADIEAELAKLTGQDAHDHGGAPGRDDERVDHLRATLQQRESDLKARIIDLETREDFKGAKDLDAEAFGN